MFKDDSSQHEVGLPVLHAEVTITPFHPHAIASGLIRQTLKGQYQVNKVVTYPRLLRRVQAVLIDSLLIPIALFGSIYLISLFAIESPMLKGVALIAPFFVLEPLLVALTGGTVGHHLIGIRVRSIKRDGHINILLAIVRFVVKMLLGWVSFIFVLTTLKHQAIHDMLSGSIVVNRDTALTPSREALPERVEEEPGYISPSKPRRVLLILGYTTLAYLVISVISVILLSTDCLHNNACSRLESVVPLLMGYGYIILVGFIIVLSWRGKLYGGRKQPVDSDS